MTPPLVRPVTLAVHEDEKAWSLRELNLTRPPLFQRHRWQIVTVIRNDELTEWWADLGPAAEFTAPEFEVPSLLEHSVAELRDIALEQRLGRGPEWTRFVSEQLAESTLIGDFLNQAEEQRKLIHNQSVFGPGVTKQRNGFDRKAALHEHGD